MRPVGSTVAAQSQRTAGPGQPSQPAGAAQTGNGGTRHGTPGLTTMRLIASAPAWHCLDYKLRLTRRFHTSSPALRSPSRHCTKHETQGTGRSRCRWPVQTRHWGTLCRALTLLPVASGIVRLGKQCSSARRPCQRQTLRCPQCGHSPQHTHTPVQIC